MSQRRRLASYALACLLAVVGAALLWGATGDGSTSSRSPLAGSFASTYTPPATTSSPSSTASPTTRETTCHPGVPERLVYPALGVDAPFEKIGLDRTAPKDSSGQYPLGNPRDRTKAGWYEHGPKPGSGAGTVLTNGHTYRNGSAIFKEDFAKRVRTGQLIHLVLDNGDRCSYVVTRVWREVNSKRDYPRIIASQKLYDFSGPERLLLVTCGGSWNAASQNYDDISIVLATPVGR
ncbi:hypothetical protein N865_08300 [Intrasporangium oryzae NRRL B-24470]|uniref:Sortase n=1 Tax=Intrasporangium oryzae NRRL B-24470 TaxID=1386089 RepID=W9G7D3_9MICO|nr:class F sortase [Intrasporangium oryzae]EWS99788.1 hypothetical protein N865_08300 [Intrasporangium oryzae NRRL B-24470]